MDDKLEYKVKRIDITEGAYAVLLNQNDAEDLGLRIHDRVKIINSRGDHISALVDITDTVVKEGEIGVFVELWKELKLKEEDRVKIVPTSRPASVDLIKKRYSVTIGLKMRSIHSSMIYHQEISLI